MAGTSGLAPVFSAWLDRAMPDRQGMVLGKVESASCDVAPTLVPHPSQGVAPFEAPPVPLSLMETENATLFGGKCNTKTRVLLISGAPIFKKGSEMRMPQATVSEKSTRFCLEQIFN